MAANKRVRALVYGILGGVFIAFGGTAFLSVENKVMGTALFTVGLFGICTLGLNLFTGKLCYIFQRDKDYAIDIPFIYVGNFIGTWLVAMLERLSRIETIAQRAAQMCEVKINDSLLSLFILGILCNVMIYLAVEVFNKSSDPVGKYIALFFGVMVFILCGFEHSIADMYYISVAAMWSPKAVLAILAISAGNFCGGIAIPLVRSAFEK